MSTKDLKPQENPNEEKENFYSLTERLIKDLYLERPNQKDVCNYMIKWLMKDSGYSGTLLSQEEKQELGKLRREVDKFNSINSHYHKIDLMDNETSDIEDDDFDPDLTKENITKRAANLPYRNSICEEIYEEEPEKAQVEPSKKSEEDTEFIRTKIMILNSFNEFQSKELEEIISYMTIKEFKNGEDLITYGNPLNSFYLIKSGKLDCYKQLPNNEEKLIASLTTGDYFGQIYFSTVCESTMKLKVIEDGECFILDRDSYLRIKKQSTENKQKAYEQVIDKIQILKPLEPKEKSKLANYVKSAVFYENEIIYNQGEIGNLLYIIESGECYTTTIKEEGKLFERESKLKAGTIIDEKSLIGGVLHEKGLVAGTPIVKMLSIDRNTFESIFGPVEEIVKRNEDLYKEYFPQKEEENKEEEENKGLEEENKENRGLDEENKQEEKEQEKGEVQQESRKNPFANNVKETIGP